jgi:drug/metabolite transporter (DMT)-like permease
MAVPLIAAIASAGFYGVASVLQAVAARRTTKPGMVDARLLVRVLAQRTFLAGIGLDILGFACQFYALRTLPLFLVQAALAANLAVTAVVAIPVMGVRLSRWQWSAVAAVCVGLALLGISAGAESSIGAPLDLKVGLLASAVLLGLVGLFANRLPDRLRGPMFGAVGGLGFGVLALAVRAVPDLRPRPLLTNPATYAAVIAGAVGFTYFAAGLQQASVTTVTAAVVVTETDRTRPGLVPLAVAGFLLAVIGALGLARFGDIEAPET